MYKCCIFDLDGTLINSIEAIAYASNLALNELGFSNIAVEEYKLFVGDGVKTMIERLLRRLGDMELENLDRLQNLFGEFFAQHYLYEVKVYENVIELLAQLKEKGIYMAVLSNKPHIRTIETIAGIFGDDCFKYVQGEDEANGLRKKPNPDGVYQILNKLGISKEECLYIGDTNTDMETGKNAGVDTVGVTWGFRTLDELQLYCPTYIVNLPLEIIDIVKYDNESNDII